MGKVTRAKRYKRKKATAKALPVEGEVVLNKITVADHDGKERISLFVEDGNAILAFYDKDKMVRFVVAVQPDGSALMSATHPTDEDNYSDCFRLVIKSGEPEIVLSDAIFKNVSTASPRGFFSSRDE